MLNTARYLMFFILILLAQLTFAQSKATPFKVLSLTSRQWMGGAAPGKTAITYTYKVLLLTDKKVSFKNTWIGKEYAPVEVQTFYTDPNQVLKTGDSLLLVYTRVIKPETKSVVKPLPLKYKGTALIEYLFDGKTKYFSVKQAIESLRTIKGV